VTTATNRRVIRAPHGPELSCRTWQTEAAMRMLMNNLDPDVAENPDELVVYGGIGKAARNWQSFDTIVRSLKDLAPDETLLVQSGKPVGVFRTHTDAPRVLIANSNLVPHWATWEHFRELEAKGLMMYGQMTAGSWIYIGSQGIVQGTYETFAEVGRQHYNGDLKGRWILTGGLGGMGGAQPLAATMAGASMIAVECQASRIERRLATRYVDRKAESLDEAMAIVREAKAQGQAVSVGLLGNAAEIFPEIVRRAKAERKAVSVGLLGNAAEVFPELVRRGVKPDAVTDQTSAHDPLNGYLPAGWSSGAAGDVRNRAEGLLIGRHGLGQLARQVLHRHRAHRKADQPLRGHRLGGGRGASADDDAGAADQQLRLRRIGGQVEQREVAGVGGKAFGRPVGGAVRRARLGLLRGHARLHRFRSVTGSRRRGPQAPGGTGSPPPRSR